MPVANQRCILSQPAHSQRPAHPAGLTPQYPPLPLPLQMSYADISPGPGRRLDAMWGDDPRAGVTGTKKKHSSTQGGHLPKVPPPPPPPSSVPPPELSPSCSPHAPIFYLLVPNLGIPIETQVNNVTIVFAPWGRAHHMMGHFMSFWSDICSETTALDAALQS